MNDRIAKKHLPTVTAPPSKVRENYVDSMANNIRRQNQAMMAAIFSQEMRAQGIASISADGSYELIDDDTDGEDE